MVRDSNIEVLESIKLRPVDKYLKGGLAVWNEIFETLLNIKLKFNFWNLRIECKKPALPALPALNL